MLISMETDTIKKKKNPNEINNINKPQYKYILNLNKI